MSDKVPILVSAEVKKKLDEAAAGLAEGGMSGDKLGEVIIDSFFAGKGKVFSARWKEGPGIRVLPDWPRFSSFIIKVKSEEMR